MKIRGLKLKWMKFTYNRPNIKKMPKMFTLKSNHISNLEIVLAERSSLSFQEVRKKFFLSHSAPIPSIMKLIGEQIDIELYEFVTGRLVHV